MRRDERGFTLIELAIVMVIIGILLGAVLKGQDLIQNARAKKFVNKVRAWEVATWTFLDRKGRFPGDDDKDGKIGGTTSASVKTDLTGANFINPPYEGTSGSETNTITLGSYTFYVFFGTDAGADAGKNVMIICKDSGCANTFTNDELQYIDALDSAIDGSADGTDGQFVCDASTPDATAPNTTTWIAAYASGTPSPVACTTTASATAAIYYFDAKR